MAQSDLIEPVVALIRSIERAPLIGAQITVGGDGPATGLVINARGVPGMRTIGMEVNVNPGEYAQKRPEVIEELTALIQAAQAGTATKAQADGAIAKAWALGNAALQGAITAAAQGITTALMGGG